MMTSCEVTEAELQKLCNLHVPNRELERLVLLRQCACLDTGADESFDRITQICSRFFKVSTV
jgi:hypothetical protein